MNAARRCGCMHELILLQKQMTREKALPCVTPLLRMIKCNFIDKGMHTSIFIHECGILNKILFEILHVYKLIQNDIFYVFFCTDCMK